MVSFELQGIGVQIVGDRSHLLTSLARDFAGFPPATSAVKIKIEIVAKIPWSAEGQKTLLPVWNGSKVKTKGWWNRRVNIYRSVTAESIARKGIRNLWVEGHDEPAMREVIYKFVLSALGEELELQGYHRVHGCGFTAGGFQYLVFGRSGVGKSSLAAQLIGSGFGLFSDESPLLKGQHIFSFPTRLSLDSRAASRLGTSGSEVLRREGFIDKILVPYPQPAPLDGLLHRIYLAKPSSEASTAKAGLREVFGFVLSCVFGLGLAQMAEWMLRISALPRLSAILFRRLFLFTRLALTVPFLKAGFTFDPSSNFRVIDASLRQQDDHSLLDSLNFSN